MQNTLNILQFSIMSVSLAHLFIVLSHCQRERACHEISERDLVGSFGSPVILANRPEWRKVILANCLTAFVLEPVLVTILVVHPLCRPSAGSCDSCSGHFDLDVVTLVLMHCDPCAAYFDSCSAGFPFPAECPLHMGSLPRWCNTQLQLVELVELLLSR